VCSAYVIFLAVNVSAHNGMINYCSRSFRYSRSLGLLEPVIHGVITCIQETLEIGRRGSMGRRLNGNTLAAVNGHLRPLRESVAYERDVGVEVPATVIN
jgi:hypothetical protein